MLTGACYTLLFALASMVGGLGIGVPVALPSAPSAKANGGRASALAWDTGNRAERRLNRAHAAR